MVATGLRDLYTSHASVISQSSANENNGIGVVQTEIALNYTGLLSLVFK